MMRSRATLLLSTLCYLLLSTCAENCQIGLQQSPVIYGEPVELICSSKNGLASSLYWRSDENLLFTNEYATDLANGSKFKEEKINSTHHKLTISSFEFSDIKNYSCSLLNEGSSIDLTEYARNFVYLNYSAKISNDTHVNDFVIYIVNISSIPTCNLTVQDHSIQFSVINKTDEFKFLYSVELGLNTSAHLSCVDPSFNAKVICNIYSMEREVELFSNLTFRQSVCNYEDVKDGNEGSLLFLFLLFVPIPILILIVSLVKKSKGAEHPAVVDINEIQCLNPDCGKTNQDEQSRKEASSAKRCICSEMYRCIRNISQIEGKYV